jgi:hypothetical protein
VSWKGAGTSRNRRFVQPHPSLTTRTSPTRAC